MFYHRDSLQLISPDMGWYGVICNDMTWNDSLWYEIITMIWNCIMKWHGVICNDMDWYDMINGKKWYDMKWHGLICNDMVKVGMIESDIALFGVTLRDLCERHWYGLMWILFSPTAKVCYGVFSPEKLWCDPVQLQHQVPGKVPKGSGRFRWRYLLRFRRGPVQIPGEVSEGFNADSRWGCAWFRCRYSVRFQKVQVQVPGEVPEGFGADTVPCEVSEGSDADTWWGSGGFRCR